MAHSVTVTSSSSWFSRLAQSAKSVLVGLVFFFVSFPLLFWNEGRAVRTAKSLAEGAGAVVSVGADRVDSGNEGKLVHVSGAVTTDGPVVDEALGVEAEGVKLVRNVEIYQWKEKESSETRKKLGGGSETVTTYTYDTIWSEETIDSTSFHDESGHENRGDMPLGSTTFEADGVHLEAFELSPEQIAALDEKSRCRWTGRRRPISPATHGEPCARRTAASTSAPTRPRPRWATSASASKWCARRQ